MSLHLNHSTPYSDAHTNALRTADGFCGWQSAGMAVEFLFGGRYRSIAQGTGAISKQLNPEVGNLPILDPQVNRRSGRYRQKLAVPI